MGYDDFSRVIRMIESRDYTGAVEAIRADLADREWFDGTVHLDVALYGALTSVMDAKDVPCDPFFAQVAILKIKVIRGDHGACQELDRLMTRWKLSTEACHRQYEPGGRN